MGGEGHVSFGGILFLVMGACLAPGLSSASSEWQPGATASIVTSRALTEDGQSSYGGLYRFGGSVTHQETKLQAGVRGGYLQEYSYVNSHGEAGDFLNTTLSLGRSWGSEAGPFLREIGIKGLVTLPTSKESSRQTFRGGVGPQATATFAWKRLSYRQTVGYAWRLYGYDIRDDGTVNSPHQWVFSSDLSLDIGWDLSAEASYMYQYLISYQGVARALQNTSVQLSWQMTSQWLLGVGVENEQGVLDPDGSVARWRASDGTGLSYYLVASISI